MSLVELPASALPPLGKKSILSPPFRSSLSTLPSISNNNGNSINIVGLSGRHTCCIHLIIILNAPNLLPRPPLRAS